MLSLDGYYKDMPANELVDREDFIIYACELMRDRLMGAQIAGVMGWNEDEVKERVLHSPLGLMFRRMLFARVVPNLKRLGLITPRVREAFERMEIIEFENAARPKPRGIAGISPAPRSSLERPVEAQTTWRREWDSNPRYLLVHTLSKRAP